MYSYNNFPDFSQMRDEFEERQKKINEYYQNAMYNPQPNQNVPIYDITSYQNNTSPEPLAPLGANARVIDPQRNPVQSSDISSAANQISDTVNIWDQKFKAPEYQAELGESAKANSSSGSGGGAAGIASGVSAGLGFAGQAYGALQGVDQSESESWKKTGQLAMSGAATGMQIGGPWGAAIGAVVGGAAGVINMSSDRNKRNAMTREKIKKENQDTFDKRQRDYEIKEAERQIELLTSMSNSQLNYIK